MSTFAEDADRIQRLVSQLRTIIQRGEQVVEQLELVSWADGEPFYWQDEDGDITAIDGPSYAKGLAAGMFSSIATYAGRWIQIAEDGTRDEGGESDG